MHQHLTYFIVILFLFVCYTNAGCNRKLRAFKGNVEGKTNRERAVRKRPGLLTINARMQSVSYRVPSRTTQRRRWLGRPKANNVFRRDGLPEDFKETTLSPKAQFVLSQLSNSKIIRDKKNYKALLQQLKNIFHTTKRPTQKCGKCG
ncbi:uncharacterized protein LOC128683221 [Plodia interpunctella]|uniref:uncharacterized protein LOC128683221 n=1 Tax=Plodia interpunctella TaxID=58824 RepID=UPI0023685958|nr:uncharacterized protein LOC128683221 [Plodia interpunctella]